MHSYPGSLDVGRRPSLTTESYMRLMVELLGQAKADLAALRADIEAYDDAYALAFVRNVGSSWLVNVHGGVSPFVPAEEAVGVDLPLGGPWRSAFVGSVTSGVWFQTYFASAIGTYPDSGSSWQGGVVGQADLYWIDSAGYTQILEPRRNIVPVMPNVKSFRLELASNLSLNPANANLIQPIPVWFTRRAVINDMAHQGY